MIIVEPLLSLSTLRIQPLKAPFFLILWIGPLAHADSVILNVGMMPLSLAGLPTANSAGFEAVGADTAKEGYSFLTSGMTRPLSLRMRPETFGRRA